MKYLDQLFAKSQEQGSIFCIKANQRKSCYVENVCLERELNMDILVVVCGITRTFFVMLSLLQ